MIVCKFLKFQREKFTFQRSKLVEKGKDNKSNERYSNKYNYKYTVIYNISIK